MGSLACVNFCVKNGLRGVVYCILPPGGEGGHYYIIVQPHRHWRQSGGLFQPLGSTLGAILDSWMGPWWWYLWWWWWWWWWWQFSGILLFALMMMTMMMIMMAVPIPLTPCGGLPSMSMDNYSFPLPPLLLHNWGFSIWFAIMIPDCFHSWISLQTFPSLFIYIFVLPFMLSTLLFMIKMTTTMMMTMTTTMATMMMMATTTMMTLPFLQQPASHHPPPDLTSPFWLSHSRYLALTFWNSKALLYCMGTSGWF